MRTMRLTLLIVLPLTCVCAVTGHMETHNLYAATASSLYFPGVKMDENSLFDLRKDDGSLVLTYHGTANVRGPYVQRVIFFPHNGTTFWKEVRKEDSGLYQYVVNFTEGEKIHLQVIDSVSEPVIWKNVQESDGHCHISLTCRAQGEGPLLMTILKNLVEVVLNISTMYNSTTLHLDGWDPQADGMYSCSVRNPVSFGMSLEIKVKHIPTHLKKMIHSIFGILFFALVFQILLYVKEKVKMQGKKWTNRVSRIAELFGFLKDFSLMLASLTYGAFFPILLSLLTCFIICRIFWYLYNHQGFCGEICSIKSALFQATMTISWLLSVSLFLVLVRDFDNRLNDSPCDMMNKWMIHALYVMIILTLLIEILCFGTYIKKLNFKRKPNTRSSPSYSDLQDEEEQTDSIPEGKQNLLLSDSNVFILDDNLDQGAQDYKSTKESPEEQKENKILKHKSHGTAQTSGNGGSENSEEDEEAGCSLAAETEVALDKDQVANG